ncbi:MAG: hypothetical protein JXR62_01180 [Bacilli bacterium]|nr:hypothetical protein [Bacilli bacterium]
MRKILIFLGVILISLTLAGCNNDVEITVPVYTGVTIEGELPAVAGELTTFYKAKNDVVRVEIAILNPSNVPISSIVIDGYKYFSARFTEDSTNQLVKFDMNTGTTLGEKVYSIDEVVYDDGPLSKSVEVNSNNTFKVYVYKNTPTVLRESYVVSNETIRVDFAITDTDNVIEANSLVAELYAEEELLESVNITTGKTFAEFTNLPSDGLYEVKVRASFDLDDSNGLKNHVILYSDTFVTYANAAPVAIVSNAVVSGDQIVLNVSYTDEYQITIPGSIYVGIYKDNQLQELVSIQGTVTGLTFKDLLSNQQYVVKVLSGYNLNDGSGDTYNNVLYSYAFITPVSVVPTPQVINLKIDDDRVSFDIQINDPEGIILPSTLVAKLYIDGVLKQTAAIQEYKVDFQLYNLLSGFDFSIEVEASYDLNDGSAIKTDQVIYRGNFTTTEKTVPTLSVSNVVAQQGYVTVNFNVTDPSSTIQNALVATLYENNIAVQTIQFNEDETQLIFNYLIQYQQVYSVKIIGNYNLQDGTGLKSNITMFKTVLVTNNPKAPVVEFNNVVVHSDSIEVDTRVMDSDNTVVENTVLISIYTYDPIVNSEVLVESQIVPIGTTNVIFENLKSGVEYRLVASADYNINDGSGTLIGMEINSEDITTNERIIPTVVISDLEVDTDSVMVYYDVLDPDNAIITGTLVAILTYDNVPVGEPWVLNEFGNTVQITGLTSGLRYKVDIYSDYDLNNGEAIKVGQLLDSSATPIPATKIEPEATLENVTSNNNSITFDATIIDDDDAIIDNLKAVLYKNGELTSFEIDLVVGRNDGTVLADIEFGVEYELRIIADYTYNDGTAPILGEELATANISTIPLVIISNVQENDESISFRTSIDDTFDISDSSVLEVALYDEMDNLVGSVHTISSGTTLNLFNLWSDFDYYIIVTGSYSGVTGEVARYDFHTAAKEIQPLEFTNLVVTSFSISYEVNGVELPDSSGVINSLLLVNLYLDGVLIQSQALNSGSNANVFYVNGTDGSNYVLQIEATINLNDSYGSYDGYVIDSISFIYSDKIAN